MTTFADLLARRLRDDPGQPLVTWYDQATGERVELSTTTYANWVAKTASLLAEEHDAERGQSLRVDLPTHWLTPVFLGAAWTLGLVVTTSEEPDLVVCGPDPLARWVAEAQRIPVLACSLRPMGVPFAGDLPAGVHDVGVEVWSQPDAFTPWDPPGSDDPATDDLTQGELGTTSRTAAEDPEHPRGIRLLSTVNPASPPGVACFLGPLAGGGSLVLVAHADPEGLASIYASERCTSRWDDVPG